MAHTIEEKIRLIQDQIEDLITRLPAHSIPKAVIIELDEVEGELARLMLERNSQKNESKNCGYIKDE